ncbi:DUF1634 domain-containing protein [Candidatus Marsarchaeota archaeon]|jgi:uncharacterized membrane protein|nr:DUF1634 domain-containing protein [Candidatus Marsarchaeota archaeon]
MTDLEYIIGNTLRIGVVASIIIILTGLALLLLMPSASRYAISIIASPTSKLNSSVIGFGAMLNGLESLDGVYYIMLGLAVLIATPVARVLLSVLWFFQRRNVIYTVITFIVLTNILVAIFVIPHFI